ncbi:PREDICTED: proline-rich protein 3-like [Camelina sativa]|uniref:Proline-rich protein 3-like n=1 Tax=Camelina sativa TaxID=90675 RepID=A0ABM0XIQ8_CAMSA|nr:PREDICTED: proline-rich protein 3-like [Camelina sativa]
MAQKITTLVLLIEILFLVSCVSHFTTTTADNDVDVIHVAGKVMCQDCSLNYGEWINGSEPIKGAVVSITCMDERRRVRYYGSDKTDERGQFDLIVNNVLYGGKELKPQLCNVRLVSSPDQSCDIPTNFGDGLTGVKLVRPFMVFKDLVKYVVGPFYYTTPMCETPKFENNY